MTESSAVERELSKRFEDAVQGKPLSRRARQTKRSVESYLAAGVLPRYMQRLRDIEDATRVHRQRLRAAHERLREECPTTAPGSPAAGTRSRAHGGSTR
jgi:hypothetical protein